MWDARVPIRIRVYMRVCTTFYHITPRHLAGEVGLTGLRLSARVTLRRAIR